MLRNSGDDQQFLRLTKLLISAVAVMLLLIVLMAGSLVFAPELSAWVSRPEKVDALVVASTPLIPDLWQAPDESSIPEGETGNLIRYGRELIAHTSEYLGPKGKVMAMSNGMNCQNCHLNAGTKPFGNNYSAVASTYPKYRARSGSEESIEKRVNDCFERSLNGQSLDDDSHEMKAIVAYITWLGQDVVKGSTPKGSGLIELAYLDRPADPEKGMAVYTEKCVTCHGKTGEGIPNESGTEWIYPPLWGDLSYNYGAGLFRLSRFAGYIKSNMPLGTTYNMPQLADEEAWDVAAYVNSLPRPKKDLSADWPDVSQKPVDHPFGPFSDGFSKEQHKYGPFKPIKEKAELSKRDSGVK